jgi:hypothetical protein
MNRNEAEEVRKALLDCHLKDGNGNEIKRITLPNPDDSKYEGCALIIKKNLDKTSFLQLKKICSERKLKYTNFEKQGFYTIYSPKTS